MPLPAVSGRAKRTCNTSERFGDICLNHERSTMAISRSYSAVPDDAESKGGTPFSTQYWNLGRPASTPDACDACLDQEDRAGFDCAHRLCGPKRWRRLRDLGIVHAACPAIIERSALVTRAFTVQGKQIMHVTPTPPTVAQLVLATLRKSRRQEHYWNNWPQRFDYVYVSLHRR
jgi:hypothetical protein